MRPQTRNWESLFRSIFFLITAIIPVLVGYVVYHQWGTLTIDCALDWQTGVILDVPQDSYANYAGLMPGDVILSVDGVPFQDWRGTGGETSTVEVKRGEQHLTFELPLLPLAQVNLPSLLNAGAVAMTFWAVGTLLLWRRSRQRVARLFFLMTQSVGIGLLFFLAYPQVSSRPYWMDVLISIGFHVAGSLLVHYSLTFPVVLGSPRQRRWVLTPVYGLMFVALACRLSSTEWGLRLSFLYNTAEIVGALAILLYSYLRRATSDGRRRLRLVVLGSVAPTVPSFFLYLLPTIVGSAYRMPGWMVGPLIIIVPLSYFLAIVRHNLFDIDRILNRTLVYAILSLGILLLYLGPFLLIYRLLPDDVLAQVFIFAGMTLLVGLSFDWTRTRVQRLVDRLFYGGWYDYPGVVESISDALARSIERAQLTDVLTRQVPALMQLHSGQLWIGEPDPNPKAQAPTPNLPTSQSTNLPTYPLTFQSQVHGRWTVGPRRDGEDFSDADRRILHTLARQAETALGNVLLVETLRRQLDEIRASRETLAQTQRQLLRSREDERARLARDLHDGPIQALVGLNLQLGLLLAQPSPPAHLPPSGGVPGGEGGMPLAEALQAMRAEVRGLLADLRRACADLRPPMLDTLGLGAALRALADEWSAQSGVAVHLDLPPDATLRPLPGEVSVNLYRVVQEALTNVAHHAAAQHVTIRLAGDASRLVLIIQDNGRGFAVPTTFRNLTAQGHFGLVGMQECVDLIGGAWTLESAPDQGTTVRVVWPGESTNGRIDE